MPFGVLGHACCNNRSELPLSLLVNAKLRDKSASDFIAHVGDVQMSRESVFLFALAPHISVLGNVGNAKEIQHQAFGSYFIQAPKTYTYLLLFQRYLYAVRSHFSKEQ